MTITFHIFQSTDCYEVTLDGYVIKRIRVYRDANRFDDVDYDDCPETVKVKILAKVEIAFKSI